MITALPHHLTTKRRPFSIVAIGASAGGLAALEQFFGHVPQESGLAFVVVQHLAPDHVGNLSALLQRCTSMKVEQIVDPVQIVPDHVYVIPPNKELLISNRTLHLRNPGPRHGAWLPIDTFFNSLADDCAESSIGVILSGMGSDGTQGMRAIREQGGLTLVQDPEDAKFDSMPGSVVDSGLADIVAAADELPARIIDYLSITSAGLKSELPSKDRARRDIQKITAILKQKIRHDFSLYKPSSILRRIERRMGIHKISSMAEYAEYLKENRQEVDLLFRELLIGVTSFFRDPDMWDDLKTVALPRILATYPDGGALRAWSCGCSTGEEAYSLAMVFCEVLDQIGEPGRYSLQIFASDLDATAIEKARRGIFKNSIASDVSPERLKRFFLAHEAGYQISKQLREMIIFAEHDVIKDPPYTKLDLVICRNLLIYLSSELQQRLMPLFHYCLKPGGLLFLGSAESIGTNGELFAAEGNKAKLFWRSETGSPDRALAFPTHFPAFQTDRSGQEFPLPKFTDNLQQLADQLILQHFSSPVVVVNDQGDIIYISGRTGKYLEPAAGKANMNIFAMAREGLLYDLGSAFRQVLQQPEPVTVRASLVKEPGGKQDVDMTLVKIAPPEALQGLIMIAFKDVEQRPKRRRRSGVPDDGRRYEELEQELMKVKTELRLAHEEAQTAKEEMRSINEELQSTNEELQSSNEELITSKEEMQSMNEELRTVNAEQSARLEEYLRANNDMENLLNSTEIVTIFLDDQLQVRRFTAGANRLFKLIPGDLGRPLSDIASNLVYPQLYDDVQEVLRKLVSMENQVATNDGRWLQVRIMPYRTMEKMIDGVVITCIDITTARQIEAELLEKISRLEGQ